jgi:formylglycine-generating enzyme required for sulfatase activity
MMLSSYGETLNAQSKSKVHLTESDGDQVFQDELEDGTLGPKMVIIPAGTFMMGDIQGDGWDDENPVHKVTISKPFAIGVYEVTVGEFKKFVKDSDYTTEAERAGGCHVLEGFMDLLKIFFGGGERAGVDWRNPGFDQTEQSPVVCVSWGDAVAYTKWLRKQTGYRYQLPTEAQWEYAARAGTETKYPWGNDIGKNRAHCNGCGSEWGYKRMTAPVGLFSANQFGLYNTVGNVLEWVHDRFGDYSDRSQIDPKGSNSGRDRVARGGSWDHTSEYARSTLRHRLDPSHRRRILGFRVMREMK